MFLQYAYDTQLFLQAEPSMVEAMERWVGSHEMLFEEQEEWDQVI